MSTYFELIMDKKLDEAESLRKISIPTKLIQFISLNENTQKNERKFKTLENEQLWFSSVELLNDPYEFKCMYVDEQKLKGANYPDLLISQFNTFMSEGLHKWAVACLSANSFDCLPMWAYYTNNYEGFCVEYDVVKPDAVYKVGYEPARIPIASIIANFCSEFHKMIECGQKTNPEVEFYATLMKQQFFLKHMSWSHENEYRIIYPLPPQKNGILVPIDNVGLKTSKVVAGLNCKKENVERLSDISNYLKCGDIKRIRISSNNYTLLEEI